MTYQITVRVVAEAPVAAVKEHMPIAAIPRRVGQQLSRVWEFLKSHAVLRTDGHNVLIYHEDQAEQGGKSMPVEFGVQVVERFKGSGDVFCSATPAGTVATAVHVGPYDGLGAAHGAVRRWCAENHRVLAGRFWEIYGDWNDDQSKLETEVLYLLR